nr:receptor kinase-like protein Xa21 [Coffea arabica]
MDSSFSKNSMSSSKGVIDGKRFHLLFCDFSFPDFTFRGHIPKEIGNVEKLTYLSLMNNNFTGVIPREIGKLHGLKVLMLGCNNLTALYGNNLTSDPTSMELSFITSLTKCKNLVYLDLGRNPLKGLLPASVGNLSASLEMLILHSCEIKGTIPSQTSNLTNLLLLDLQSNHLTGGIPTAFKNLQNLQGLAVGDNNLNGTLDSLCNLRSLTLIGLATNQFSGSLPECFGNMTSLRDLTLGNNFLVSATPNSFWKLKDLLQLNLSSNSLNGSLPLELGTLKAVTFIDVLANQFSGDIPRTTGDLQNLLILNLSQNQFHGSIPESFGKMLSLQGLYLSHNNLSGFIPKSMEALRDLQELDVSYNHLSGEIPSGGRFRNFTTESFLFNDALCRDSRFHVPPCPITNSIHRSRTKKVLLYVFAPLGIVSVVVAALAIVFRRYWKNYRDSKGTNMVLVPTQERVSYYDLLRATGGYSESNVLGIGSFGSVYKGILNNGRSIAVKVFNLELEGVLKSFDVECEVLKNHRHRNLLKVISGYWNQDFRALVLEYMCNGSLEKRLHSDNYFLDTLQRLNIMIDVASAVQYLHEEYLTPVIHCDLKPSNVLLDEDMVAHVSDFGIAKMLEKDESFAWTKTLATIGYIAPEYGSEGLISAKCDVYSYGIMLMEVFSRRKPNDEMFVGNLNLKSWINDSLPDSILQVIDAKLLKHEDENFTEKLECFSSIMELALKCVRESPTDRLSMKVVLETVKKIKLKFLRTPWKPIRDGTANDRHRILTGGPWIVDNQVLVLSEWYEGIEEDAEAFRSVPLWVQVCNLPIHWMSKEAGRRLGSNFQSVREVIVPQTGGKEGRHLKLLVVADISQPLLRGTIVKVGEQTKWASFKYERCPDFCYKCGIIGHSKRNCQRQDDKGVGKKDNQYGPWLRIGNVRSSQHKQQVGTVYNPQKHHWRLQDGEWREQRQSEGLEKALESQLDNESGLARKLVADTGLVTSSGRGQDGQGSGSIGDVRVHSEKLNESGSKVGSELTEILHIGQSKGVISNPNCRAQMQGYLNQKNSSQSNQPLKVQ